MAKSERVRRLRLQISLGKFINDGNIEDIDAEYRDEVMQIVNELTEDEINSIRERYRTITKGEGE